MLPVGMHGQLLAERAARGESVGPANNQVLQLDAIPHDIGIEGLRMVGDSTWPGLGTVACVLGSRIAAEGIAQLAGTHDLDDRSLAFVHLHVDGLFQGRTHVFELVDAPVSYCSAGTSASGCQALLSGTGTPSATATSGAVLTANDVEGAKDGLYFFGTNGRQTNPWGNGTSYQCVVPPVRRAGLLSAQGTTGLCDGWFTQDVNARWAQKPPHNPGSGAVVGLQLSYRDPQNSSHQTTSLSSAMEFTVCP